MEKIRTKGSQRRKDYKDEENRAKIPRTTRSLWFQKPSGAEAERPQDPLKDKKRKDRTCGYMLFLVISIKRSSLTNPLDTRWQRSREGTE